MNLSYIVVGYHPAFSWLVISREFYLPRIHMEKAVECSPAQTINNESYCPLWIRISGKVTKVVVALYNELRVL
jgi:hypothetical protein